MNLPALHPVTRVAAHLHGAHPHGHGLHIGRPVDGPGYVAHCGCRRWGGWKADRRQAVRAYHRHLASTHGRAA